MRSEVTHNKLSSNSGKPPLGNSDPPCDFIFHDQRKKWEAGERIFVESYLEANPQWRFTNKELLDLIYHEILIQEGRGEHPTLEDYSSRFPHLVEELRLHFEIHNVLSVIEE